MDFKSYKLRLQEKERELVAAISRFENEARGAGESEVGDPTNRATLKLLNLLDEGIPSRQEEIWVDVFDLAKCRTQSDIQEFFPGITKFVQMPILGIWSLGHLTEVVQGFYAHERILKLVEG